MQTFRNRQHLLDRMDSIAVGLHNMARLLRKHPAVWGAEFSYFAYEAERLDPARSYDFAIPCFIEDSGESLYAVFVWEGLCKDSFAVYLTTNLEDAE